MTRFDVKVDAREVIAALDALDDRVATKTMATATKKGAVFLAQKSRPLAPRRKSGRRKAGAKPLHRTISARTAKRDKPGAVVVVRAPHRHLVMQGTAERFHKTTGKSVGVMPSNPFIDKAADMYGDAAIDRAMDVIESDLGF